MVPQAEALALDEPTITQQTLARVSGSWRVAGIPVPRSCHSTSQPSPENVRPARAENQVGLMDTVGESPRHGLVAFIFRRVRDGRGSRQPPTPRGQRIAAMTCTAVRRTQLTHNVIVQRVIASELQEGDPR